MRTSRQVLTEIGRKPRSEDLAARLVIPLEKVQKVLAIGKRSGKGLAQAAAAVASRGCQFQGRSSAMRRAG